MDETMWVLRAQVGDRNALDALFRAVQEPLYRYVVGLVSDSALAEDVLQEVLVSIYRNLGHLREPALFRPWCYRIATHEAFRQLKRHRRWTEQLRGQEALDSVETAPEPATAEPELLVRLPDLLGQVSPASRTALALHYLNGLTLDEVAEVLGLAVGTVKSRLAYGLMLLRRLWKVTQ
jgi:RNA polymerase sigma-70 factor, ECF subfamily